MRTLAYLILLLLTSVSAADCSTDAKVAVEFMNQYLAYSQAVMDKRTGQSVTTWLGSSRLAAPGFAGAYSSLEAEGLKTDPELGWGVDLILDAQDLPDKGFKLSHCSRTPDVVLLQGLDRPAFKVAVKVVPTQKGLKVLGAGKVNVPAKLRAPR